VQKIVNPSLTAATQLDKQCMPLTAH
jgi:hypothetical protein